jgi:hypothetical protein
MDTPAIFMQTTYDSGALSGLSSVAHKFEQAGVFAAVVHKDGAPLATVKLAVSIPVTSLEEMVAKAPEALAGTLNALAEMMPHVDLARLPAMGEQAVLHTAAQGYALFHAMSGDSGFAITVHHAAQPATGAPAFDTRQLGPGDIFSALVLRPGAYAVKNTVNGSQTSLTVAYPVVGTTPYVPPNPAEVTCADNGFSPAPIKLQPAQGLIFRINTRARITIDLVTPDDGPAAAGQRKK